MSVHCDIEMGVGNSQTPPSVLANHGVPAIEEVHSTEDLLKRAREVTASGKFIFSGFSELNVFVLLHEQDYILRLQRKLHASVDSRGPWTEEDITEMQTHVKQYCNFFAVSLTRDEALSIFKSVLSWDRPPFRDSHSAGEFLFGHQSPILSTNCAPARAEARGDLEKPFIRDFGETDYIDLCPENLNVLNSYFRRRLPAHFQYNAKERRVVAHLKQLQTVNKSCPLDLRSNIDAPIWRGSSASVDRLARVVIALAAVAFLIAPMFVLTYVQPTGYVLLSAAFFAAVFGVIFALSSRAREHEVVGVTAAYAAVLMVFVGNAIQARSFRP
jgi:hypothetical protein